MDCEQWSMDCGQWTMVDGLWTMVDKASHEKPAELMWPAFLRTHVGY